MKLDPDTFRRLCDARDLLRDDADEPLSVQAVAEQIEISPFHFIRQFATVFGLTPNQFRMRWRIDRARFMLAAGERSVTEVCMAVGFSSLGTFSSLFKREVGESPTSYRRSMRIVVPVPGVIPPALIPGCLTLMGNLPADAFRNSREA